MRRNEMSLQEMFAKRIKELNESGKWGTVHIYQAASNAFNTFMQDKPLPLGKLSAALLKQFENYLRQHDCSWNTISTYLRCIRAVFNRAVDGRYVRYVPRLFECVYTGTKADRKKALEIGDISLLIRKSKECDDASGRMFALMFMLRGIPFVDLAYMHKRDLCGNVISYRRRKTGKLLVVTLTPETLKVVKSLINSDADSPYLFPILHSAEGTRDAYREYQSALRKFNQQLSLLREKFKIGASLSSYSARHTWATMAYYCEIHPGIISEAMGHSSITVTETYLKPFCNKKLDEANQKVINYVKGKG